MPQLNASVSLDLDNKWSYMKTHGDAGWESFPSYLDLVVPRVLEMLDDLDMKITFFIVGQDAAMESNRAALAAIADAGHEIGNHSFHHEPWLHLYSDDQLREEFDAAEQHLLAATGAKPIGFRGPGFSFSDAVKRELTTRGYLYDGSTFPTFIGPLARLYYFMKSGLSAEEKEDRKKLFGDWRQGFQPIRPYYLADTDHALLEIPVTTLPILRSPIHLSYVQYLAGYSRAVAMCYFRWALFKCRMFRVEPSILLHPLDFLGADDEPDLGFFPAMQMRGATKLELMRRTLTMICQNFDVLTMEEHARRIVQRMPPKLEQYQPLS